MARRPEMAVARRNVLSDSRRSLIGRIRSSEQTIIVISGPAGAGKTALVEAWAEGESNARLLSVSRYHNAAGSLLDAVFTAVGAPSSTVDHTDMHAWVDRLTRALDAASFTSEQPCRLVLDGVDVVTDPDAKLLLRDLAENCPPTLRILVTTRHRSPEWINRSRARGEVMTIRAEELRLSPAEVESLLGEDMPELNGWALGIGLVAALGEAEAGEAIRDYLHSDVMTRVTTEVQHLLHAVTVAGEVDPALIIHLTDNPAAGEVLARFASTTQFATVAEGPVFKLHPVLAAFLLNELVTEHWESYVALRRRHADWLVAQGRLDRATRLYVESGATATARTTLLAHWQRTVLSGHLEVIHDALDQLSPVQLAADPRLCVVMAMVSLAAGDLSAWQRWIDVAEAHENVDMEPGLPVSAAIEVSRRFTQALTSGTMRDGTADRLLPGLWNAVSELATGLCLVWEGDRASAVKRLRRAEVASRVAGDQLALAHALAGLALAASFDGDSHAVVLADEAIALSERLSPRCRWVAANAYLALATVRLATGSVRGARQAVNQTLTALAGIPEHLEQRTRAHALELLEKVGRGDGPGRPVEVRDLSARERRVLNALCSSLTLREIADELCVSHNTVKSQVSSIFRKLSVHDRAAAVAAARSRASGRP